MSQQPVTAETSFHVRYAETDAMGIVHHASYIIYFEEGRSEYLRQQNANYVDFERQGFYLAVTGVQARYIKAAHFDDRITVRCWVSEMRSRTLTFQYEILLANTQEILLTGQTDHICLNNEGGVRRLPEVWQSWV